MLTFKEFYLLENILSLDKKVRKFDTIKATLSKDAAEKEVSNIIDGYKDAMNDATDKFVKMMKGYTNRGQAKLIYNTKSVSSIISKVVARSGKLSALGDLIRGAILFDTQKELDDFVSSFTRKETSIEGHDKKEKGGDAKFGYYGSHHFKLNIDGFIVELQAMTKNLWKFKKPAHDIYTDNREKTEINKQDRLLSFRLFKIGNTDKSLKESIDEVQLIDNLFEDIWIESE